MTNAAGSRRVFVSYSLASKADADLLAALRGRYDISEASTLASGLPMSLALTEAIRAADAVLVILPEPNDAPLDNVLFEAGIAVGLGRSVVVVGDSLTLPRSLATFARVARRDLGALDQAIAMATRKRRSSGHARSVTKAAPAQPALSPATAQGFVERLTKNPSERDFVEWVAGTFREAGAAVVFDDRQKGLDRADLSLWHDDLQAVFGLPLPVEVLISTRSLKPILARLQRTMRAAGATSLVAVSATQTQLHARWTDGISVIMAVDAARLVTALSTSPLPEALSELLSTATAV